MKAGTSLPSSVRVGVSKPEVGPCLPSRGTGATSPAPEIPGKREAEAREENAGAVRKEGGGGGG